MTIGASMRDCALHHYDDRSSYNGLCSTPKMMIQTAMRDCALHHTDDRSIYEGLCSTPQ
jgi:hypothetical protein